MQLGEIIMLTWSGGYVLSVYPIYRALNETHLDNMNGNSSMYSRSVNLKRGDVANSALGASLLGLGWFLALPFYASFYAHKRRKPVLAKEADAITEDYNEVKLLRAELKKARAQIEAHATEAKSDNIERYSRRDYDFP